MQMENNVETAVIFITVFVHFNNNEKEEEKKIQTEMKKTTKVEGKKQDCRAKQKRQTLTQQHNATQRNATQRQTRNYYKCI